MIKDVVICRECIHWVPSLGRDWTTTGRCRKTKAAVKWDFYCGDGDNGKKECIHRKLCVNECPCDYLEKEE